MDEKIAEHLATQIREVNSFRRALTSESDRGCALFAAAYLDVSLSNLLYVSLVENKSIEQDLFRGTAPLANFSSRIQMAYYLGLISKACRRDLNIVRSIRNDFAHDLEVSSFQTQSIRDRSRHLSFSYYQKDADPRSHFTAAVMGVLAQIHAPTLTVTPHTEKPDDSPSAEAKEEHRKRVEEIVQEINQGINRAHPKQQDTAEDVYPHSDTCRTCSSITKGLRVRKKLLPFVACVWKTGVLRVRIWSAHESDVVGLIRAWS